jgi:hypothetical protein
MTSYFALLLVNWMILFVTGSNAVPDVQLFTMQKDSEFLQDWVHYHGRIFGYDKLTIIDTDSSHTGKQELNKIMQLGVTVNFQNRNGFRDKLMQMSANMLLHNDKSAFLVPLDIDEFLVAVRYGGGASTFSMNKTAIWESFGKLSVPVNKNKGMKYKFNTFDAIDCSASLNIRDPPRSLRHHQGEMFVEDRDTLTRCGAKTFYHSDGFSWTDDGNHYGKVMNESKLCFTKSLCRKCYHKFMKSGLGLLHFSTHSMNYNEIKEKMLQRFSVLSQFNGKDTLKECSNFKKNAHYCKFHAHLLQDGDQYLIDNLQSKRQAKCAARVFRHSAPAALFSSQQWTALSGPGAVV